MVMAINAPVTNDAASADRELIDRTRAGDERAYAELYQRHHKAARATAWCLTHSSVDADDVVGEAFTQILATMQRGRGPTEAFRPYLLSCVRHACAARSRNARAVPVDPVVIEASAEPVEDLDPDRSIEARLMAQAFASLPERWQTVLWQVEVEGQRSKDLARELGMAPPAVAALAYRARGALAEAYLEAHLAEPRGRSCQTTVHHLPAAVRGKLGDKQRAQVEAHLASCDSCRAAEAELQDLNRGLRSVLLLAVAGIPAASYLAARSAPAVVRRLVAAKVLSGAAAASVAAVVTLPVLLPSAGSAAAVSAATSPAATVEARTASRPVSRAVDPAGAGLVPVTGPVRPPARPVDLPAGASPVGGVDSLMTALAGGLPFVDLLSTVEQVRSDALGAVQDLQGLLAPVTAMTSSAASGPPPALPGPATGALPPTAPGAAAATQRTMSAIRTVIGPATAVVVTVSSLADEPVDLGPTMPDLLP